MVAIASCHGEVTSTILQTMMDKTDTELKDTHCRFLALGLALTYLGKQEEASLTIEALKVVGNPLGKMAATLVEVRAWGGRGTGGRGGSGEEEENGCLDFKGLDYENKIYFGSPGLLLSTHEYLVKLRNPHSIRAPVELLPLNRVLYNAPIYPT